jgi:hypothetical protein
MKKQSQFLLILAALFAMLISACGGTTAATETETSAGSNKPLASLVEFTGVIEAINGDQWTIDGQLITVDPSTVRDGIFKVGDTVKIEAEVQADGSLIVTRVESPTAGIDDNSNDDNSNSGFGNLNGNGNDNTNSSLGNINGNSNDNTNSSGGSGINSNDNGNGNNSNDDDDNGNGANSNDDNDNDNDDDDNDNDDDNDDDDDDNDNDD